jgi:thiosulfate/3-mercaptopyruvate sulfurtransferase
MYRTLISSTDLAAHTAASQAGPSERLGGDWLIVDCRFDLANPKAGEAAYAAGHIPQAVYAHLDRDLAAPITAQSGRHPLPSPQQFAAALSRWGLTPATQVIAYDADSGAYAARLWWMLRWIGHAAVAVLDGGFRAWTTGGHALATDVPQRTPTQVSVCVDPTLAVTTQELVGLVQRDDWRVLDARAPERFAGSVEPIDRVAGHVPGARNHPFTANLSNGRFLPADELRRRLQLAQQGVATTHTIAMCGSGVTACHLLLALEHAGMAGARLYPGSWSEWIRDPQRPVAQGA